MSASASCNEQLVKGESLAGRMTEPCQAGPCTAASYYHGVGWEGLRATSVARSVSGDSGWDFCRSRNGVLGQSMGLYMNNISSILVICQSKLLFGLPVQLMTFMDKFIESNEFRHAQKLKYGILIIFCVIKSNMTSDTKSSMTSDI